MEAIVQTVAVRQQRLWPLVKHLLANRDRIVPAAELAGAIGIRGNHENGRRRVREVVEYGRREGYEICANRQGYWLAEPGEWSRYLEHLRSKAKGGFVRVRRQATAATERRASQGKLF